MQYKGFIDCVKKAETSRVKALSIPTSCALTQIPCAFQLLIPNMVRLIEQQIDQLCHAHQILAWFGLQVTSGGIQSTLPKQLNRIHYPYYPDLHFCCVLSYLALEEDILPTINNWQDYQSLVIDFTSGYLMDNQHYIFLMLGEGTPGHIYGALEQKLLKKAWALAREEKQLLMTTSAKQSTSINLIGELSACGMQL